MPKKDKDDGKNERKYKNLLKQLEQAISESEKNAKEKTRQYIVRAVGSNVVVGGKTATTTFKRKRG
jgi:flagellar hook-basal body complex protein FliE